MANYKLSENASLDLIRIHQRGVREFGEQQADAYFRAFFERFEQIAEQPLLYPTVDEIRPGYRRSVCGVDTTGCFFQSPRQHVRPDLRRIPRRSETSHRRQPR